MACTRCGHTNSDIKRIFCEDCGKLVAKGDLTRVGVLGFVGVGNSTSPAIQEFWATGDPSVFDKPGDRRSQ